MDNILLFFTFAVVMGVLCFIIGGAVGFVLRDKMQSGMSLSERPPQHTSSHDTLKRVEEGTARLRPPTRRRTQVTAPPPSPPPVVQQPTPLQMANQEVSTAPRRKKSSPKYEPVPDPPVVEKRRKKTRRTRAEPELSLQQMISVYSNEDDETQD